MRIAIAKALGEIGNSDSIAQLETLANDADDALRKAAKESLAKIKAK